MNLRNKRFVIIGAGSAGISLAYFLFKNGVHKITVFEKDVLGSGSTGRCAGIVSTQLWNEIDVRLVRRSIEIFEEIAKKAPYFKVYKMGLISVARKEKSKTYIEKISEILREEKIKYRVIFGKDVEKRFHFLKDTGESTVLETPDDLYCDPGMFLYAIYSYLRKMRIEFRLLRKVEDFKISNKEIKGVWIRGVYYPGDVFIICSGVWTKEILEKIGIKIPLLPYRSQIGILRKENVGKMPIIHDLDKGIYMRGEYPDKILVGDGTETKKSPLIYRETPDEKFVYETIPKVTEVIKNFEDAEYMGGWAGLCSATPDRHPVIGKIPKFDNLFIMTGFNGFGFMRMPAIAENFSMDLLENRSEIDISSYSIKRFEEKEIDEFEIKEGFSFID